MAINLNLISVGMIIGGIIVGGSALMYGYGKLFIESKLRSLKNAPELKANSNKSMYGYTEGMLHADNPIDYKGEYYIRLDESIFHITNMKVIGYTEIGNVKEKKSQFQKKTEFVHRTAIQAKPVFINNMKIQLNTFIASIGLQPVDSTFESVDNYLQQNQGQTTNVNIKYNANNNPENIIGEQDRQVIGIEHQRAGIKSGELYTIFGKYNHRTNTIEESNVNHNIITQQSREDFIQNEENFLKGWKFTSASLALLGAGICVATGVLKYQ